MGKSKRKIKPQLKQYNENKIITFNDLIKSQHILQSDDDFSSENVENIFNNPLLMKHIKDIQNINESILVWNNEDVIDERTNENFQKLVNNDLIKDSMKNSPFSGYLKTQLIDLTKVNPMAVSGVIMKSCKMVHSQSNESIPELSNNNYIDSETSKKSVDDLRNVDQHINLTTNNNGSTDNASPQKSSETSKQSDVSSSTQLRRSGRSSKKNYLEMINIQIFDNRKVSDSESVSSNRKSLSRRPNNNIKSSIRESNNVSEKKSVQKESDNFSSTDKSIGLSTDFSEARTTEQIDKQDQKILMTNLLDDNSMSFDLQPVNSDTIDIPVGDAVTRNTLCKESSMTRHEETPLLQQNDQGIGVLENDIQNENSESNNTKKQADRRSKSKKVILKVEQQLCVVCNKSRLTNKNVSNLCIKCCSVAKKIVNILKTKDDYVCVDEPPCWSEVQQNLCEACTIQKYMECGVQWGGELTFLESMSVEELRRPDFVARTRKTKEEEAKNFLEVSHNLTSNTTCHSCVLSISEPNSIPCKWNINVFIKENQNNDVCCSLCKMSRISTSVLYTVLPTKEHYVCHQCLLTAYYAYNELIGQTIEMCDPLCVNVPKCSRCLLGKVQLICSLQSIQYRFFDGTNNPLDLCEICRRQDASLLSVLRSGNLICLVCVWRIKLSFWTNADPCRIDTCSVLDCLGCLRNLAEKVLNVHEVITHYHDSENKALKRAVKRRADNQESVSDQKFKRPRILSNPLIINANWSTPESGESRRKRIIKSFQYNDYIVDNKCLLHSTSDRVVKARHNFVKKPDNIKNIENESVKDESESPRSLGSECKEYFPSIETENLSPEKSSGMKNDVAENNDRDNNNGDTNENKEVRDVNMKVENEDYEIKEALKSENEIIKCFGEEDHQTAKNEASEKLDTRLDNVFEREDNKTVTDQLVDDTPKTNRRIKQPTAEETVSSTTHRGCGPRVKQVSRQNVNMDLNLDSVRQKCVVKRANRIVKTVSEHQSEPNDLIADETQATDVRFNNHKSSTVESKCGVCTGCLRNRCCGKCDSCLLNKSQRRKTETCLKMICVHFEDHENDDNNHEEDIDGYFAIDSGKNIGKIRHIDSSLQHDHSSTENGPCTDETTLPVVKNGHKDSGGPFGYQKHGIDVYRDSDSDDLSSEEEQLDPELDSIHIAKGDIITTTMAHEGGFPIITSFKSQPNKILCFSCGSGGDQMLHCVSCAEPFHFFCIEYQFRPKSKEMFVCRNCTPCHTCQGYGSDLKCIKCHLGFHPSCVIKYPPAQSEDRSNWACYKCAMCLHCGSKAEDAMQLAGKFTGSIDWNKDDPWQCGRCYRARKNGQVCPECGRAYQSGLETIECTTCSRLVHRQCSGLTEDEYEVLRSEPVPSSFDESHSFKCSKCSGIDEDNNKRVRLKRQCKESGLKVYCENRVMRNMNDFINKGQALEESILGHHNISESGPFSQNSKPLNQFDGIDDGDSDNLSLECESLHVKHAEPEKDFELLHRCSPVILENTDREMNQTNSTVCNSSESIEEYDIEQLSTLEYDQPSSKVDLDNNCAGYLDQGSESFRTKIGIFSRLNATDFLSPKHMIMETLARIIIKLTRHSLNSHITAAYNNLISELNILSDKIFSWVDFSSCFEATEKIVKENGVRLKLILQSIYDSVRESRNREFDVFSSTIWEIEEKLNQSFQKSRDEFVIYHSEQHLTALMKNLETRTPDNVQVTRYRLAFETEDKNNTICEKDIRRCALCGFSGDDGLEGRLIYGGLDVWVHVNCALWSDEVYEREDGALVNVEVAIKRGNATKCSSCDNFGATIACSAEDSLDGYGDGCANVYHFGCAFNLLTDPVFTDSRAFYCSEMHESHWKDEQQLGLADMLILRRIYLPQGCLSNVSVACCNSLQSSDIVVTIGNLRIDSLGKMEQCSDSMRTLICPVGYSARRLFWSTDELDSLVMYFMSIRKELNTNIEDTVSKPLIDTVASNTPIIRRRRMIDSTNFGSKRSKQMECRQDIVYEMDDEGNLEPIATHNSKCIAKNFYEPPRSVGLMDSRKVNRRFPINFKIPNVLNQKVQLQHNPVDSVDEKDKEPQIIKKDSNNLIQPVKNGYAVPHVNPAPVSLQPIRVSSTNQQCANRNNVTPISVLRTSQIHPISHKDYIFVQNSINKPTSNPVIRCISSPALQSNVSSHSVRFVNSSYAPKVLTINKMPQTQSERFQLGSVNVTQPQIRKLPNSVPTRINVPQIVVATNRKNIPSTSVINASTINGIGHHGSQLKRILKITRIPSLTHLSTNHQVLQQHPVHIAATHTSSFADPSLLKTILTAPPQPLMRHTMINNELSRPPLINNLEYSQFSQYDGEADDCCSIRTDNPLHSGKGGPGSVISDQENMSMTMVSANNKSSRIQYNQKVRLTKNYEYCLRFSINGFKSSKTARTVWTYLVRRVAQLRKSHGAENYTVKTGDGWSKFGIDHQHVVYLLEQMVGAFQCVNYEFKYHKDRVNKLRNQYSGNVPSLFGCSRFTPWEKRKANHIVRDPLAFLHCKANHPPKNHAPENIDQIEDKEDTIDNYLEQLASQFRQLASGVRSREKDVRVCCSSIHGRGLFARREFQAHDIIIEYVGEIIRSILSDVRETEYQRTGVDCYMFRLDQEYIVDATFKGNAARFINHSCHPNCYAKVVRFEGEKHIIIIAQRKIYKGEELTYDYRFPIEDDKLPCTCGSFSCKKYLN